MNNKENNLGLDIDALEELSKDIDSVDTFDIVIKFFYETLHKKIIDSCNDYELFEGEDISYYVDNLAYFLMVQFIAIVIKRLNDDNKLKPLKGLDSDSDNYYLELREYVLNKMESLIVEKRVEQYGSVSEEYFETHIKYINIYNGVFEGKMDLRGCSVYNAKELAGDDILRKAVIIWADIIVYPDIIDGYDDYSKFPICLGSFVLTTERSTKIINLMLELTRTMGIIAKTFMTLLSNN